MKIKWIFSLLLVLSVLVVGCAKSTNETTLT